MMSLAPYRFRNHCSLLAWMRHWYPFLAISLGLHGLMLLLPVHFRSPPSEVRSLEVRLLDPVSPQNSRPSFPEATPTVAKPLSPPPHAQSRLSPSPPPIPTPLLTTSLPTPLIVPTAPAIPTPSEPIPLPSTSAVTESQSPSISPPVSVLAGEQQASGAGSASLGRVLQPTSKPEDPRTTLIVAYQLRLSEQIEQMKSYPADAAHQGWEGRVLIRLRIGSDGGIAGLETVRSSGFASLDRQARINISRAKPLTPIPESLKGQPFEAQVEIIFTLPKQ